MDPSHRHHHHHHRQLLHLHLHLHLDPHHHHHIHIRFCPHRRHSTQPPLDPAPPSHPMAATAPWQQQQPPPEPLHAAGPNDGAQGEATNEAALHLEQAEEVFVGEGEEEPVFVLTDEWAEFFAKSEAKRRLAKQQKKNKGTT